MSRSIQLPYVDSLGLNGTGRQSNGADLESFNFFNTPARFDDFAITAIDILTDDGQAMHVDTIKFHPVGGR